LKNILQSRKDFIMETQGDPTCTYNGKTYNISALSEEAKKLLSIVQTTENEILRLQNLLVIAQTAQTVFKQSFIKALPESREC